MNLGGQRACSFAAFRDTFPLSVIKHTFGALWGGTVFSYCFTSSLCPRAWPNMKYNLSRTSSLGWSPFLGPTFLHLLGQNASTRCLHIIDGAELLLCSCSIKLIMNCTPSPGKVTSQKLQSGKRKLKWIKPDVYKLHAICLISATTGAATPYIDPSPPACRLFISPVCQRQEESVFSCSLCAEINSLTRLLGMRQLINYHQNCVSKK